jgi:hypothetical protein
MSNLGLGVMINILGGKNRGAEHIAPCLGEKIESVEVNDKDCTIRMQNGAGCTLYDDGQNCCEHRHMSCDDDLAAFVGSTLIDIEIAPGPELEGGGDEYHDSEFLRLKTSDGVITIVNHNEHNGYYGGFYIVAGPAKKR